MEKERHHVHKNIRASFVVAFSVFRETQPSVRAKDERLWMC